MRWQVTVERTDGQVDVLDDSHGRLDEVIVGDWLHFEHMNQRLWYLRLGAAGYDVWVGGNRLASSTPALPDLVDLEASAAGDPWSVNGSRHGSALDVDGRGKLVTLTLGRWLDLRATEPGRWRVRIVRDPT